MSQAVPEPAVMPRSQEEIAARIRDLQNNGGLFEFGTEVLAPLLDRAHFGEFAKDDADLSDWFPTDPADVPHEAAEYLDFAFGKARDHRGISAIRSVQKMTEFAWLQGRDDVVEAIKDAEESNYGVGELMIYARAFDLPVPDGEDLARMAGGDPCRPGCDEGCGR